MTKISDTIFAFKRSRYEKGIIMKKFLSGGSVLLLLSLLAVFIYAQTTTTDDAEMIAKNSQLTIEKTILNSKIEANLLKVKDSNKSAAATTAANNNNNSVNLDKNKDSASDKKLVEKTASVKATSGGRSRGSFSATAYCLKGRTAMGHGVRRGIIAADPRVLKLGSTITISAGPWSGTYLVSDTGGNIKGKRLDIWVPNCSEARKFGRRSVQVFQ